MNPLKLSLQNIININLLLSQKGLFAKKDKKGWKV